MTEQNLTIPEPEKSLNLKPKRLNKFSKYPLYANEPPLIREKQGYKFVPFGKSNDYPDYLAYLYNNSGIHGAIVDGKAAYIFGKGWHIKEGWIGDKVKLQALLDSINSTQTLDELSKKIIFERVLYGGRAYLIEVGVDKKLISTKIQPFNTIRTNKDVTEFYISKEWTREMSVNAKWKKGSKQPDDMETLQRFSKDQPAGKYIYYVADDNPASDVYPLPEYQRGNTPIETDIECGFFHLNNVKTGFAAGTMITFFTGMDDDDEASDELERKVKGKTTGSDNAGEVILNFQSPETKKPEIDPLRSNELDKQYEQLAKDTINKILYAHRVTNGLLFGIKTPGELGGGRSEFDLAWEHFCNTYVKPKQAEEALDINYLVSLYGFTGDPLELKILEPLGIDLDIETIKSVLSKREIREMVVKKIGLENSGQTETEDLLAKLSTASPLVANKILDSLTPDEVRSTIGLGPVPGGNVLAPTNPVFNFKKFEDDIVLGKFLTMGVNADEYTVLFEVGGYDEFASPATEDDVLEALKGNKKITVKQLAEKLGISQNQVYKILDRINGTNDISIKYIEKGGEVVIKTENITNDVQLLTMWRYNGPRDAKNRPFCKKMLGANRLYTREEINGLQNDMKEFNTDVWKYKGGWYHDPTRDVNVPQCRHSWQQVIVKKK